MSKLGPVDRFGKVKRIDELFSAASKALSLVREGHYGVVDNDKLVGLFEVFLSSLQNRVVVEFKDADEQWHAFTRTKEETRGEGSANASFKSDDGLGQELSSFFRGATIFVRSVLDGEEHLDPDERDDRGKKLDSILSELLNRLRHQFFSVVEEWYLATRPETKKRSKGISR